MTEVRYIYNDKVVAVAFEPSRIPAVGETIAFADDDGLTGYLVDQIGQSETILPSLQVIPHQTKISVKLRQKVENK